MTFNHVDSALAEAMLVGFPELSDEKATRVEVLSVSSSDEPSTCSTLD